MRVLMIAPPGAGKGTQGALIAKHFSIPHIASGDILRDHVARDTDIGRAAAGYLDRGELVPDGLLYDALRRVMAAHGHYVLDGMPRTVEQARELRRLASEAGPEAGPDAHVVLHLRADDEEVTRRLLARGAHSRRSDDTEPVIRERLHRYHRMTAPVTAWYKLRGILLSVDAMRPAHLVGREIIAALEALHPAPKLAVD
ncbi:adenylate kinase family protein [Dactylosporangium sp. McL0621]|uniref:adenylate kinase family protein n=1 Tax=Dactylosporangium sp. McL0621 TaxID=3415678 RepID=UPI003CF0DABC